MKDILGLLVLAWPLTLLVLIGITFLIVVPLAVRYAAKHGRSKWRWGIGAFLLVYLPIFWDWLPTVAAHRYYCAKDSGFWVYKTLEQWKAENPGVIGGLVEDRTTPSFRVGNDENHTDTHSLNQYFSWKNEKHRTIAVLPIYRWQDELIEKKNNHVVARRIGFSAGEGKDSLKFWADIAECPNGNVTLIALRQFVQSIVIVNTGEIK